ncbi:protein split ends isoform X3 [Hyalella azteca]|uniref:Protein split ends isoform X3 n=1 Tax=Hyalella azteca TaxID=294128 RepID=A0A8B7PEC7_HYAAZ|nr:protein split ends isoform X3 [Hyalella azteca]
MPRSASVSAVPRRLYTHAASASPGKRPTSPQSSGAAARRNSLELLDPLNYPPSPREYDSWPCDSFFLLPDSVLGMDAGAFRADLTSIDPALCASLPDWSNKFDTNTPVNLRSSHRRTNHERSGVSLRHSHQGLTVTTAGRGTILIGGGGGSGDGRDGNMMVGGSGASPAVQGPAAADSSSSPANFADSNNAHSNSKEQSHKGFNTSNIVFEYGGSEDRFVTTQRAEHSSCFTIYSTSPSFPASPIHPCIDFEFGSNRELLGSQCRSLATISEDTLLASTTITSTTSADSAAAPSPHNLSSKSPLAGPNELFFGTGAERTSNVSHRDREERLRQLRERQQNERQQKLEELKEHANDWSEQAAAAQRFREQQEAQRRQRLQELRSRDQDRRLQVEERRRVIEQADQQRREASIKKNERDQRLETKRRNERSNIVFAFGSSTPRMLDPKETSSFWGARRATSISNVTLGAEGSGSGSSARRSSDCVDSAAAAAGGAAVGAPDLARKRATSAQGLDRNLNGADDKSRSSTTSVARRRTDLHPIIPSLRDSTSNKPRRRSPGRAVSMSRLDQLAKPRQYPHLLAPLHEKDSERMTSSSPHSRTRSMTHLAGGRGGSSRAPAAGEVTAQKLNKQLSRSSAALVRSTRAEQLRQHARLISGGRSGGTTPNQISSRPTSALSQTSSSASPAGVVLRARTTPRKPRPMSIGGSAPSAADRPRSPSCREGRTAVRNTSSGSLTSVKSSRAKSVGGPDSSAPSTPAKTAPIAPPRTPKRTPAQVKADSNAKKAEKAAALATTSAPKRPTPKASPGASPTVENKPLTAANRKVTLKKSIEKPKASDPQQDKENSSTQGLEKEQSNVEVSESEAIFEPASTVSDKPDSGIISDVKSDASTLEHTTSNLETAVQAVNKESTVESETTTTTIETSAFEGGNETKVITETVTTVTSSDGALESVQTIVETSDIVITSIEETVPSQEQTTVATTVSSNENTDIVAEVEKVANTNEAPKPGFIPEFDEVVAMNEADKNQNGTGPSGTDRPVTGYASEEEYKAVLAEKRRLAREAREREIEMERQKQIEEAERERREEEEMLRLMEEQKKAEEERLRLAIEQADREREEELKRKAEEEKLRIEAERQEAERQKEAEEKLRKEEEERKSRKDRVAAIMARTRRGGSLTPNKSESKTPSDESKTINEALLKANLTDSMIDKMSDSMIAAATIDSENESCQASSGVSSQPMSDASSQPNSDVSSSHAPSSDVSSQSTLGHSTVDTSGASSLDQTVQGNIISSQEASVDLLSAAVADITLHHHTNGNVLLTDTTNAPQSMDLLGSLNGHTNGVNNCNPEQESVDLLGSFNPITSDAAFGDQSHAFTTNTADFEQIIDAGQFKLTNEDAINSNPPADPFIAFEQNLNKKTSENNTSVPDILM